VSYIRDNSLVIPKKDSGYVVLFGEEAELKVFRSENEELAN